MPRPKHNPPLVRTSISIPAPMYARLQLVFLDPIHAKAKYGSISSLITRLLKKWLEENDHS